MPDLMNDLNELRNSRNKMAEREKMKFTQRFTELPTPVLIPPPKGMPRNSEVVQGILDRGAMEVALVLHQSSRKAPFDERLLRMAYDQPRDFDVAGGGYGWGGDEETGSQDTWRFFRRTGGNGTEWSWEESHARRVRLLNPFRRLVLSATHDAGSVCPTLDLSPWRVDDESLLSAMRKVTVVPYRSGGATSAGAGAGNTVIQQQQQQQQQQQDDAATVMGLSTGFGLMFAQQQPSSSSPSPSSSPYGGSLKALVLSGCASLSGHAVRKAISLRGCVTNT
jgi:hypothetical protein